MKSTDVDDKDHPGAIAKRVTLKSITRPYVDAFFSDQKRSISTSRTLSAATLIFPDRSIWLRPLEKGFRIKGGGAYIRSANFKVWLPV